METKTWEYIAPSLEWKALLEDSLCVSSFNGVGTSEIEVSGVDLDYENWLFE